ncbi:MAG: hypothetical protein ABIN36_08285 [Ferruginibacter sp.]
MKQNDSLNEFSEVPSIPKGFWQVWGLVIFQVSIYIFLLFPSLKYALQEETHFNPTQIFLLSFIIGYPLVGSLGFFLVRKFGWVIVSHYSLSTVIITAILMFSEINYKAASGDLIYSNIFATIFLLLAGLLNILKLFSNKYLTIFGLNKSHIFLNVLLSIFFPFFVFIVVVILENTSTNAQH